MAGFTLGDVRQLKSLAATALVALVFGAAGGAGSVALLQDQLRGPAGEQGEAGEQGPPGPATQAALPTFGVAHASLEDAITTILRALEEHDSRLDALDDRDPMHGCRAVNVVVSPTGIVDLAGAARTLLFTERICVPE